MENFTVSEAIYCRLCLNNDGNFIEITENDQQLIEKITKLFNFDVDEADFSHFICVSCHDRVSEIADFIEKVQQNQETLRNANIKEEPVEEVVAFDDEIQNYDQKEEIIEEDAEGNSQEIVVTEKFTEKYYCDDCETAFCTKSSLVRHMRRSHLPLETTRVETTGSVARFFNKLIDISQYLLCELCDDKPAFETFELMCEHYSTQHDCRGYVKCCGSVFYTKRSVVTHADRHLAPTDYMCSICNKMMPNKATLKDHMDRHRPDEEKNYVCDICEKRFYREYHLIYHTRQVHKKEREEKHTCVECNKSYSTRWVLEQHMRRFHLGGDYKTWICESCGKSFFTKQDLHSHISFKHTDNRQKCPICGIVIKCMRRHMQMHKEMEQEINCEVCGKKVPTTQALKSHMKVHEQKRFNCTVCEKSFRLKAALMDHMSQHGGRPRHFCHFCDRTFNNSGNKAKHIKLMHAEEQRQRLENQRLQKEMKFNESAVN
ncbi:zinc finger protein 845-like [Culicoides brevitarsis]|uniref:zinc finger protein 845-like n=1 Tax=Culicoides brevitarsis TaxID=469753 RepID=UPI00307C0417